MKTFNAPNLYLFIHAIAHHKCSHHHRWVHLDISDLFYKDLEKNVFFKNHYI